MIIGWYCGHADKILCVFCDIPEEQRPIYLESNKEREKREEVLAWPRLIEEAVSDWEEENVGLPLLVAWEHADEEHGCRSCNMCLMIRREGEEEVVVAMEGDAYSEKVENLLLIFALLPQPA